MDRFRILLVADDPLARAGLSLLLESDPHYEIAYQCSSADLLDGFWPDEPIDVVIWDCGWEAEPADTDWLENPAPIIALLPDAENGTTIWQLGVQALLPRQLDIEHLQTAVRAVTQGLLVIDPQFTAVLTPPTDLATVTLTEALTPRELDVLQQLARGLTNKAIGQQLEISNHTVKFHVTAIMSKLNAQSRTDAVVRATQLGLITL